MPPNFGQNYSESFPSYGYSMQGPSDASGYSSPTSGSQASMGSSAPSPYLLSKYDSQYQTALNLNNANYNNILSGYNTALGNISSTEQGITGGYNALLAQVIGGIQGVGASQKQEINDTYANRWGAAQQQMIDSGLGNTTVRSAINRGYTLDQQKAAVALANQIAQLQANYQTQIGMAGLDSQRQAMALAAGLGGQYMGVLGGYRTPYPVWPPSTSTSQSAGRSGGGGGRQQSQSTGGYSQQGGGGGYSLAYTLGGLGGGSWGSAGGVGLSPAATGSGWGSPGANQLPSWGGDSGAGGYWGAPSYDGGSFDPYDNAGIFGNATPNGGLGDFGGYGGGQSYDYSGGGDY